MRKTKHVLHVQCYIDDILITGTDDEERLHKFEKVLESIAAAWH